MAQKDARIRFLERELAEREKEMETMMKTERPEVPVAPEEDDERLRNLERKVRELEALVKGLMEEVLDVKSVAMELSRDVEERRREPTTVDERMGGVTVPVEPQISAEPRIPAQPVVEEDDSDLELIMQNDGTLKPEPRRSSEYIVASARFGNTLVKGRRGAGKSSDQTLSVEQRKRKVGRIIQADEDDTLDLRR